MAFVQISTTIVLASVDTGALSGTVRRGFRLVGSSLKLKIGGIETLAITDTRLTGPERFGVRSSASGAWNDFDVTAP